MAADISGRSIMSPLPTPAIHPYAPHEFADRQAALDEVTQQLLEDGRNGRPIQRPVLLVSGASGMGKSWLIRHIEHEYASQPPEKPRLGTVAALADFIDFDPSSGWWAGLFSVLADKLVERTQRTKVAVKSEAVDALRGTIEVFMTDRETRDALAIAFTEFLETLNEDFVPLLLFDTVENLEERDFDTFLWFERSVIGPVVRADRAIVVLASRHELRRFRQFEVRRRIRKLALKAFNDVETAEQFKAIQIQEFRQAAQALYRFSAGLPFANWYLQEKLGELMKEGQNFDSVFVDSRLIEATTLLVEIERWLLSVATPQLANRLRLVATLRHFHIRSMQLLLADLEEDNSLRHSPDSYFQELIAEMLSTHLVRWSSSHGGYIVDPAVRRIINQRLLLQEPDTYQARHNTALKLYRGWIKVIPHNSGRFVVEAMFHIVALAQVTKISSEALREEILSQLQDALSPQQFDEEGVVDLVKRWGEDGELQGMIPDLFKDEEFRQTVHVLAGRSEEAANE